MATMTLFYAVDRWNEWWLPDVVYQRYQLAPDAACVKRHDHNLSQSLNSTMGRQLAAQTRNVYAESVKSAMIIVSAVPILMVYPFVQKYFNAGIMIGSVKE